MPPKLNYNITLDTGVVLDDLVNITPPWATTKKASYIIPGPLKYRVYNNKVVKLIFEDGTFTTAVCGDGDTFDLDTGLMVCMLKRFFMLDQKSKVNPTKSLNNYIRLVHKHHDQVEAFCAQKRKEDKERPLREQRRAEKRMRKRARREARYKEILMEEKFDMVEKGEI